MTFPSITIKATNFTLTDAIRARLDEKMTQVEKFLPESETAITCHIELARTTEHHRTGDIFKAEATISVGGRVFRAEAIEDRMEDAIDHLKEELKREIRQSNEKRRGLVRRGALKIKNMLRFGRES